VASVTDLDTAPNLQVSKQNWLDASQVAKDQAQGKNDFAENAPLDVRMSFLPPARALPKKPVLAAATPPKPVAPPSTAPDTAACAAIDAYKKRQLAAIQSDRETLKALQNAISQLGLNKQLDFMASADSKIDAPADKPVLMDMPASAPLSLPPTQKP
jgi:hypothetical protein